MRYWLMRGVIHADQLQLVYASKPWLYEKIFPNPRFKEGDIVYLVRGHGEIYSWGWVLSKETYRDVNLEREVLRVTVMRPVLRYEIIPVDKLKGEASLKKLFSNTETNLIELEPSESKTLNRMLRSEGVEAPADPSEEDPSIIMIPQSRRPQTERNFIINRPVALEETRYVEFKEVSGKNPTDSIKNTADEYAVAMLNKEGGSIFWGIRDKDRVVAGVHLDYSQRDDVRREVSNKLSQIQPHFPPSLFNLDFHQVRDEHGGEIEELWVFEADIPGGSKTELYATGSDEVFVKMDGVKRKLNHQQIVAEVVQRRGVREVQAQDPDEDTMFAVLAELTRRAQTSPANGWTPDPGSDEHRLAEKMASRNMLVRVVPGAYALPGIFNPSWQHH